MADRWRSPIDAVIVGLDPAFDYRRVAAASSALRAGARFIATNADLRYPTSAGLPARARDR